MVIRRDLSDTNFDVIIVGGGGSGLAAAVSAAEHGGKVLVLEKQPQLGGTTGIAVGSFTASQTALQRQAGISDEWEHHAEDAGKFAAPEIEACNNSELRRYFLQETSATLDWLKGMGLSFHGPSPEPPNRVPRMHNVVPGAKAYIAALQSRLLALGGEVLCSCPVTGLVRENARIAGVRAEENGTPCELRARRGVVLAAGDYASSSDLIAKYKGERFKRIEGINPNAGGDGHRLVREAGGSLVNMDITYGPELRFVAPARKPFQQLLPTGKLAARFMSKLFRVMPNRWQSALIKRLRVTWQHPEDSLFTDGAILVNSKGERFTNELTTPEREIAAADQPDQVCYILLDNRLAQKYSAWPHFISTAPDIAYAYVADYLRLRPDVACKAQNLNELARCRGMNEMSLAAAVTGFNQYVSGAADPFGRKDDQHPLQDGPWILLGPAKAYFTTTEGGAVIDYNMCVLDEKKKPIPGLYAIGQNGLGGMILWGHGLHIAWAMTSGRLVGRDVMRNLDKE